MTQHPRFFIALAVLAAYLYLLSTGWEVVI